MELILQQGLPHQQKAIDAVCAALEGVTIAPPVQFYENPQIDLRDRRLLANLRDLQKAVPAEYRSSIPIGTCLNLDIKMETGTGKTYVYTKTIYELHKRYGINKFIIAVPSLAIKAGTAQFIQDEYARRHFTDSCGYGTEVELGVLEAPKNKKKGRSYFPSVVSDFVKGSCQNAKKIYVLLVNMQLLTSNSKRNGRDAGLLWRDDYDYGTEGFYRPFDALRATKPVVMIDEPHRFSRDQKAFRVIMDEIQPQCIIRYGATFPELTTGRGRNKITVKDYQNLLYDLNACESFNQGLIKGVTKEHFNPLSKQEEKVKILSIASKDSVTFQRKKREEGTKTFVLKTGDSLAIVSDAFEGITITAITANTVEFSNGVIKTSGEEMDVDVYMSSYQEQMLRLALERHFEAERENFCNRTFKIKTLALFFIDDISSYRPNDDGKNPYLLTAFERLLKERIELTISMLTEHDTEYRAYLEASLADISACHAGYFAQDNSDSDEDIAKEVDVILHGKKQLLSFRNADGTYNTLRFLFSKWTLKEGWDNPNVFTIAKLRSSGSENSKLSEGKVKDRNKEKPRPIKIRKAVYNEMREFWEHINQRYLLFYDADLDANIVDVALALFEKPGVFTDVVMTSSRDIVHSDGAQMSTSTGTGVQYTITRPIPYGIFLTRIMRVTSIPIRDLHKALVAYSKRHGVIDAKYINESSASAFCAEFQNWKVTELQGRFRYIKSNAPCGATALTYADGTPREDVAQGRIGTKIIPGTPSSKYLYDVFAYDSPLERENITSDIEEVVVYGKIPRSSIAIPTITGSMYSPDFMYVVKKSSGKKELNIVVETKDVEGKDVLRGTEAAKIECARVFFEILSKEGYTVYFRDQINNKQMVQIIDEVLCVSESNSQ